MRLYLSCGIFCLVVTLAQGDDSCGEAPISLVAVDETIIRQLEMFLPRALYSQFTHYYFGDHIEWERLESFSIAAEVTKEDWLTKNAAFLHAEFLQDVARLSKETIPPFEYDPPFRAFFSVNNRWVSKVALASATSVHTVDQLNIFLNGGMITADGGEHWKYREKKELDIIRGLSKQYEAAQGFINDTLKQKEEMKAMAIMVLEMQTEQAVGCFYNELTKNKGTIYKTFIENVPKKKFVKFTTEMIEELKKLLKSEKTEKILTKWTVVIMNKLKTIDTEKLTSESYLVFLRARSLVLGVDLEKVFEDLDEVYATFWRGVWKTYTGQWPAMVEFISNFYKHTIVSKEFWVRVDTLYHDQVQLIKRFYQERQKSLESNMTDDILPFFRSLLKFMVQMREGKKTFIDDYISELEKVDINKMLSDIATPLAQVLSRHFLSCYTALHGKPDFDLVASAAEDNPLGKAIKELVFTNWPKEEILPKGFDDFVQKLADGIWLIVTSVLGSCTDPLVK